MELVELLVRPETPLSALGLGSALTVLFEATGRELVVLGKFEGSAPVPPSVIGVLVEDEWVVEVGAGGGL